MKKTIILTAIFCFSVTLVAQPFLTASFDDQNLIHAKTAFQKKDPIITQAVKELLESAEKIMHTGPWTVTEKTQIPPSGDKRDYMTLAPYWFPDSTKPDGLPYIRNDGVRNPEVFDYPERENLRTMSQAVLYLSLAYFYTGEQKYAEKATEFIQVWFLDPKLGMNPNLNFGQAIKGRNTGRGAGMIESRFLVEVVNGAMLMRGSRVWTNENDQKLQAWFNRFLDWADTSKIGKEEDRAMNNHGTYFEMQRVAFSIYTGQYDRARNYIENSAKKRIFHQQTEDGQMPLEQVRTMSLHYYTFNLGAMFSVAIMADKLGIDLFNYVDEHGQSIKIYMDFITPYYVQDKVWTWQQIRPFDYGRAAILLNTASEKMRNPDYKKAAQKIGITPIWQVLLTGQYQTER
ncbi:MAG: alginate lyase family protein [Bacteroidales bacterium]|jgi:hypothetical protein|nr:alginate lyase family protein [Bacteroidales bacterium]